MNNLNSKEILKNVETKIMNNEFKTKEELNEYLTGLKDRGILTQAQVNSNIEELSKLYDSLNRRVETSSNRMATRTPQRQDYANASAGFSNMNFLVLSLLTLTLAVAMINLLNR